MPNFTIPIHEANDCHNPAGRPDGGQFCSKGLSPRQARIARKREQRAARHAARKAAGEAEVRRRWPRVKVAAKQLGRAAQALGHEVLKSDAWLVKGLSPATLQEVRQAVTDAVVVLSEIDFSFDELFGEDRFDKGADLAEAALTTILDYWPVLEQAVRSARIFEAQREPQLLTELRRLQTAVHRVPTPPDPQRARRLARLKRRIDGVTGLAKQL